MRGRLAGAQSVREVAQAAADFYVSDGDDDTCVVGVVRGDAGAAAFGRAVPISSIKSYTGHTLGACGALEAAMLVKSLQTGWYPPTLNLRHVDSACAELDYIRGGARHLDVEFAMSNNFAFGGVNTSLVFRRV